MCRTLCVDWQVVSLPVQFAGNECGAQLAAWKALSQKSGLELRAPGGRP
jgi:hypothetical protein